MTDEKSAVVIHKPGILSHAVSYIKFFGSCITLWGVGYMRFSATWIALGSFGYFCIQLARNKRVQLTSSIKAIGENEKRFISQNFKVDELPSWVLKRLWPYISDYARDIIIESVTPVVNNQLPAALKPFEFVTIDLGDTPPRVGGVKVYMQESIGRDEVVMDLDLMIYSDARIKVTLGKIKAGVKEFELRGTLRVVLKPLLSKVPFFGAVTVCFLDSPYINFQLTDMGNLLGLPGLQQTLDTVVRNVVNQMIVLPNRLPVQLVDDVNVRKLKYPMPQGVIRISILAGRRLKIGDKNIIGGGSSDPYCVVRVGARTFQTNVIQKSLTPEWNEHFETVVDVKRGQSLEIAVFDKDKGNKDDNLGSTSLSLETVYDLGVLDTWTKLEGVKTGTVHLNISWLNLSNRFEDVSTAVKQALFSRTKMGSSMSSGFLYLVVEQAKNLKRLKQMREPSAYCNLLMGRDAQMTETKDRTQNPTWDSVHHFLVGDPYVDKLQLIIRDNRSETLLGKCTIEVKTLLCEKDMAVSRPFPLEDSGASEATVFLHLEFKALIPIEARTHSHTDGAVIDPDALSLLEDDEIGSSEDSGAVLSSAQLEVDTELRHREILDLPSPNEAGNSSPSPIEALDMSNNALAADVPEIGPWGSRSQISPSIGQLKLTLDYRSSGSMLSITIHEARGLIGVDKDGLADPYVNVYLVDRRGVTKGQKKKTPNQKDNLNPVFDSSFSFDMSFDELPEHQIRFDVKNHVGLFTRSGRTHYMGSVLIDLCKYAETMESETDWFDLVPSDSVSNADMLSLSSG